MELFQAGAYWEGRRETASECARRAELFFHLLGRCDPAYARWFEWAHSRRKALRLPFEPTYDTFLSFFGRRKYRLGKDGFSFDAWTGEEQRGRGGLLSLTCGTNSIFYTNGCHLYLPRVEPAAGRVLTVPVLTEVVRAMVLAWDPGSCAVVPDDDEGAKRALEAGLPCMGWLMYFPHRRGKVPPLPRRVRVEPLEDRGSLVILTGECFSLDNPEHVALAQEVRAVLTRAGLLMETGIAG